MVVKIIELFKLFISETENLNVSFLFFFFKLLFFFHFSLVLGLLIKFGFLRPTSELIYQSDSGFDQYHLFRKNSSNINENYFG